MKQRGRRILNSLIWENNFARSCAKLSQRIDLPLLVVVLSSPVDRTDCNLANKTNEAHPFNQPTIALHSIYVCGAAAGVAAAIAPPGQDATNEIYSVPTRVLPFWWSTTKIFPTNKSFHISTSHHQSVVESPAPKINID